MGATAPVLWQQIYVAVVTLGALALLISGKATLDALGIGMIVAVVVPGIVKLMSFYRLIGGRDHTKLLHRYQGHLDLSHLFHEKLDNRAVLLGFTSQPAAEVRLGDRAALENPQDKHWTCYRFVVEIGE